MNSSTKDISMKHNLGNLFVVMLLMGIISSVVAEEFAYKIETSKQEMYLKEGILLTVDLNQTGPKNILLFQFEVNKSDAFAIYPLYAHHDDTSHATTLHESYRIYPLKTGDINITFSFVKRVTNDLKMRHFASGDRDDFKKLETKDVPIALPPVTLHVKPLPASTQVVGDFHLTTKVQTHEAQAYAPIAMHVVIEGEGYPPVLDTLYPKSKDYTLFSQTPEVKKTMSNSGITYKVAYIMAFSASKDFTLPKRTLHAFNPKMQKPYTLTIDAQDFHITPVNQNTLVDTQDMPKKLVEDWSWVKNVLSYLLVFTAGWLSAFAFKWKRRRLTSTQHPLVEKVTQCKEAKALLQLLIAQEDKRFRQSIEKLEALLYANGTFTLKEIKKEILEILQ